MKLGVFDRLVASGRQRGEWLAHDGNQYTDDYSTIGDYLRRTTVPRLTMDFERDATIFREGEAAQEAFVVLDGTVRLCRHDLLGGRRILGHARHGDLILPFARTGHLFSAVSASAVTLMVYSIDRIDRLAAIDVRLQQRMSAHRAAHRRLASGPVCRTVNALRSRGGRIFATQPDAITRSLKSHGAYAAGA